MPLPCIITHILLLIQSLEIVKDVIGSLGGAYEKSSGDVSLLLEATTHGYTGIGPATPSGTTENKQGGEFGVCASQVGWEGCCI